MPLRARTVFKAGPAPSRFTFHTMQAKKRRTEESNPRGPKPSTGFPSQLPSNGQRSPLRLDNYTGRLTMCPCSTQVIEAAHSEPKVVEADVLAHYCIVRRDLPHGKQCAMFIHAAGEASPGNLPDHTHAYALSCKDECELHELAIRLDAAGVKFKLIAEPDAPYNGAFMAIGVFPGPKSKLEKHFSNLPLMR